MAFLSRIESLTEQLIACLRKGNESEGKLAAIVSSLVFVQLGEVDDELFLEFRDAILPTVRDETKLPSLRKHVRFIRPFDLILIIYIHSTLKQ